MTLTPEIALKNVAAAASQAKLTLNEHLAVQQSLEILKNVVESVKANQETEKPEQPKTP